MKELLEEMKRYLETTPLEEVVRTWMKYHTSENNVGVTMEEFLDANINSNEISPLEVLENMRKRDNKDYKYITIDTDGICVWMYKPNFIEPLKKYIENTFNVGNFEYVIYKDYHSKTINWNGKDIYSLD